MTSYHPRFTFGSRWLMAIGFMAALSCAATSRADLSWRNIQFGGFASQGYLINTGHNDYLGETSDGTAAFREYGLNASLAAGKWRVGAQVFGQELGAYGNDELKLDWASIDFQPKQWLGFRAGRVKMPRGLYNEALDIDAVRPFVLLPQSVYDARLRDFNAAFNGGMIFGNVGLGRFGSVDYRAFYGDIPIALDSGANDYFNNDVPFPNLTIGMDSVRGGSLFWNTPLMGLRTGYSYSAFEHLASLRRVVLPRFSMDLFKDTPLYERHLGSVEYITGDWVFAAEIGKEHAIYHIYAPGRPTMAFLDADSKYHYLSVARRINSRLELGAYYSFSKDTQRLIGVASMPFPPLRQVDWALSARFDINEHVLFKIEGHYMDGAGKLFDTPSRPQPIAKRDDTWTLFTAKMTVMF